MKKLLLGASIIVAAFFSSKAQTTLFFQNFEASTINPPTGWTQGSNSYHTGNPGWVFNDVYPSGGGWAYYYTPHTYVAYVDDIDYNSTPVNDYDTLYTPSFSCASASHVFISLDLNFNNYTGYEVGTIAYSTNGGTTWTTAVNLPSVGGNTNWSDSLLFDLSAYIAGQPNVMLAFTWNCVGAVSNYGAPGWGMAVDNIDVFSPQNYIVSPTSCSNKYILTPGTSETIAGTMFNWGGDSIVSMSLNYSVDGGTVQTDNLTGISGFNRLTNYNFSHNIPWVSTAGNHAVKIWADNINSGNPNGNPTIDTLWAYFTVLDSVQPKTVQMEEFSQASCDPCMYAMPNLDAVITSAGTNLNTVRYHTSWPGNDHMNNETWIPQDSERTFYYYGVDAVPDARIDGVTDANPATLTLANINTAKAFGSPFKITISSCTYNSTTKTYRLQASIKSYADMPAPVVAQAILTVDTIKYAANQSTEDPNSTFDPPDGTGSTNTDNYYQYVLNFPNVVEDMMPDNNGTALTPFTSGQTQTINVSWRKNHPWGSDESTWMYDSLNPGDHITLLIQDNGAAANTTNPANGITYPTHALSGAITRYVYQSATAPVTIVTGQEEIAADVYFELYPNPTNNNTNVAYELGNSQNVSIEVYNMLGEKVYTANEGMMSSGKHLTVINGSALQSGIYFVRFVTDRSTTTQKLVIQK